ncbi:hypothetical protein AVU43_gp12 [Ralstonia phage RSJ5]|uniref:Uncharacterized protein n=1 Tax=Ralstonia phage RSJ5 TaxID=1538364 RepID=A0A077KTD4_9CAUD|nr:hypothetical protein AVU43_gp12 [Ralstonia phage RSJ5]BAP34906.1 hypothetical protein [Ralstonia phage RSJ5]
MKYAAACIVGGVVHDVDTALILCDTWGPYLTAGRLTLLRIREDDKTQISRYSTIDALRRDLLLIQSDPNHTKDKL